MQTLEREAAPQLLHYRPWRGQLRPPALSVWPIARTALGMMVRRRLFWVLYGLGLMLFLLFFFGQYLFAFAEAGGADAAANRNNQGDVVKFLRNFLKLDGSAESYQAFFHYQGYIVMVILALAGSILVGNDMRFGSLPYYLSKPLSRWHYLAGKALAVGVFINLLTTLPALVLFIQYSLLDSNDYILRKTDVMAGMLGYGVVLTGSLSMILLATAMWLRKTVPLIMVWSTLFIFCRLVADTVVVFLNFDKNWRLFDLWNDTYLVGSRCLGIDFSNDVFQPEWYSAGLVLLGVSSLCLMYLILRIRAVEVVR